MAAQSSMLLYSRAVVRRREGGVRQEPRQAAFVRIHDMLNQRVDSEQIER